MSKVAIYILVEGEGISTVGYAGQSSKPQERLTQHRTTKESTDKGLWIQELRGR